MEVTTLVKGWVSLLLCCGCSLPFRMLLTSVVCVAERHMQSGRRVHTPKHKAESVRSVRETG